MKAATGTNRRAPRLPGRAAALAAIAAAALFFPACEKLDRNMFDNPAFKPQEEPVRLPPADSVPTKGKERVPPLREAATLINPVTPTEEALRKGKDLFGVFCVPCHGAAGAGDGPVGKKYVPTPVALRPGSPAGNLSDGEIFAVISDGSGGMPAFRSDLTPVERWHIVAWLRSL